MTKTCPHCGTTLEADVRFCSECGKPVDKKEPTKSATQTSKKPIPKGTMIGIQAFSAEKTEKDVPNKVSSPPVSTTQIGVGKSSSGDDKSKQALKNKTMIGIPAQFNLPNKKEPAVSNASASPQKSASTSPAASTQADPQEVSQAPKKGNVGLGKTMLGIAPEPGLGSPVSPTKMGTPPVAAPQEAPADSSSGQPSTPQREDEASIKAGKTMLGMAATDPPSKPQASETQPAITQGKEESEQAEPSSKPASSLPPETGRTMLGVASAATPDDVAEEPLESVPEETYHPVRKRKPAKRRKRSVFPYLFMMLILFGGAAAAYVFLKEKASKVQARVVMLDYGEGLQFETPGAPAGTKIRFGGQEKVLEAGRTTFRLASDSLRVGSNTVLVDLIYPDGKTEPAKLILDVDFRIRIDTAPLQTDSPAIDVIVNSHTGSKVTLDGKPLKLNQKGEGVRRIPIDPDSTSSSGTLEKVMQYRIQPPSGEAIVDTISTRVSIATMQIDRPGPNAVTDKESIEIAGAVAPNSSVTVDEVKVPIRAGRFLYQMALPKPGTYTPQVVVSEPGKAPQARRLNIRRVVDLQNEAEDFKADPKLTFARISQNPAIYKGQRVDFTGRVYNVNVQEGQSVLQVLVRDCPAGRRCSLWVDYPAATDAVINNWIRILGVVEGEQQFRSENERIVTVPKVKASLILPAKR